MSDQKLADGAYPIRVGKNEFLACTLTDRDYADLVGYAQHKYIQTAINASKEMNGDASDLKKFAIASATQITWGSKEAAEIMATEEGTLRIGWQMLRKRHPQFSFDDFKKVVETDPVAYYEQIVLAHRVLHATDDVKETAGVQGGPSAENDKSPV